jgi:hypothetical protein
MVPQALTDHINAIADYTATVPDGDVKVLFRIAVNILTDALDILEQNSDS